MSHKRYCLKNKRGIIPKKICKDNYVWMDLKQFNYGYRITTSTLGLVNQNSRIIRIINNYTFGKKYKIIMIWNARIQLIDNPLIMGKMLLRMNLKKIYLSYDGEIINTQIPEHLTTSIINRINKYTHNIDIDTDNIPLDILEFLMDNMMIESSDYIFEELLYYMDNHIYFPKAMLKKKRFIPDDIWIKISSDDKNI